ncbi:MAG TPA: SRPBCC domain-containing protein [Ktedonobacteraceae bacterium]|nr:SRPBCC domain-containing protein [Ktedonobacteraceae bacterium]
MEIEGTYTLQASPQEVWHSLMDRRTMEQCIPGIERLEALGNHTYAFCIQVKHNPLKGQYTGRVRIIEQDYPASYRFTIEGDGQQNRVDGEWTVQLSDLNENTVVAYKGSLHFDSMSMLVPVPMAKGIIKVLIQQFFSALTEHIRTTSRFTGDVPVHIGEMAAVEDTSEEDTLALAGTRWSTLLRNLVHQLGLGNGDPLLEEQWARRLKRMSMITALLLLVWVGTRLPGRLFTQH